MNEIFPCQLKELNLSCWGCCGRDFKSKDEIEKDIKINTQDFKQIKIHSTLRYLQFRDRFSENPDDLTPSGICSNAVDFGKGCIACPLHPKINKLIDKSKVKLYTNKDLRYNYCDINYECETLKAWFNMGNKEKENFILWAKNKKFNHYTYSIGNIEGTNIKEFKNNH